MAVKTAKSGLDELAFGVAQARYLLNREIPFLGSLLNRIPIKIVGDGAVRTACVVNRGELGEIWLNHNFFQGMCVGEIGFVLSHEVLHPAYGFFSRFEWLGPGADMKTANKAHDYLINGQLDELIKLFPNAGLKIPTGKKAPLLNRALSDGKSLEPLYRELLAKKDDQAQQGGAGAGSGPGQGGPGAGEPGDGGERQPQPSGEGFADATDCVMEGPSGKDRSTEDQARQDEMMRRWQGALSEAAAIHEVWRQSGKGRGALPGSVTETIEQIIRPQINWVESLFHMAEGHLRGGGVSYARLSKRGIALDTMLPGRSRKRPRLGILKDTSGSVGTEELRLFGGVCVQVAGNYEAEARVLQVDSKLQVDEEVDDLLAYFENGFQAKGRGGTVYEPAIEALKNEGEPVDLLLILTDGGVSWPDLTAWPCPVFVVSTGPLPPTPYASAKLELPRRA